MDIDFRIKGSALRYLYWLLKLRWGKVKINGHPSSWNKGRPPSPVFFIYYTLDIDAVNSLKLGISLVFYADDISLI